MMCSQLVFKATPKATCRTLADVRSCFATSSNVAQHVDDTYAAIQCIPPQPDDADSSLNLIPQLPHTPGIRSVNGWLLH
jgi:hypothetical protein